MDFDIRLWTSLRDEARRGVLKQLPAPVLGFDVRRDAISFSISNARAAGIGRLAHFAVRDVRDFQPPDGPPGVLVCNPPYGERIGEEKELLPLYRTMGEVFRERCSGWRVFVFTGNARLARELRLDPVQRLSLFNGKIPCQLLRFDIG
jgi:putative N6-adenine-specific DNA methylase